MSKSMAAPVLHYHDISFEPPPYEDDDEDEVTAADSAGAGSIDSNPISLDGCLYCRRGGTLRLRRRFVSLSLSDGGSIKVFKEIPDTHMLLETGHPSVLQTVYSRVHRSLSYAVVMKKMENLDMYIPAVLPWVAKDVENDSSNFVVEIPATPATIALLDVLLDPSETLEDAGGEGEDDAVDVEADEEGINNHVSDAAAEGTRGAAMGGLREELGSASTKGKPLRVHFKCSRGGHEKALWLRAFSKVGRLSTEFAKKKTLLSALTHPIVKQQPRVRTRRESHQMLARDTRHLDLDALRTDQIDLTLTNDVEKLIRGPNSRFLRDKEYRVLPTYAYPHRWMTRTEMNEEMVLPSEHFHDLRVPGCKEKEIGTLRVELLQCLGLPKLDRTSDTDATVYMVCGSYAFNTDIIPNRINPIWLRKSRRACEFPLFKGYSRLYVGVFDDDGRREKDDFAGRVVIDLARLRPRSTYDVTLPLRLSTHVYSRRKRGAIRLRFTLTWHTEFDALMSYLPKSLKIPLPQNSKPNLSVTVNCSDEKAFRNIAITVHGAHMPGRFTFHQMRSSIRELNFTRKYIFLAIRYGFRDTRHWKNPAISGFIFCAWMHAVYANAFSLVPAYFALIFFLFLMRNYVRYCFEIPSQTGFIPPSWEEMFSALVRGPDADNPSIETLDLGHRPSARARRYDTLSASTGVIEHRQFKIVTHKFRGMWLFKMLGLLSDEEGEAIPGHLEFPFSNEENYPKFGTKECLVDHKGEKGWGSTTANPNAENGNTSDNQSDASVEKKAKNRFPIDMTQFPTIDMPSIPEIMRKDSSGLKEYDEEENNFTAGKAVVASGRKAAKTVTKTGVIAARTVTEAATKTGSKLSEAAIELTEFTGLNHVVVPISDGVKQMHKGVSNGMNQMIIAPVQKGVSHVVSPISDGVKQMQKGVSSGMNQMIIVPVQKSISEGMSQMMAPMHRVSHTPKSSNSPKRGRRELEEEPRHRRVHSVEDPDDLLVNLQRKSLTRRSRSLEVSDSSVRSSPSKNSRTRRLSSKLLGSGGSGQSSFDENWDEFIDKEENEKDVKDPALVWPEQNIDIEGPATGKKLTDDLVDIKDKVHELTWHLFDDHTYVVKPDSVYFGAAKKPEKRRKDVKKQLNKLLKVGQYSHSNPFVARVGLYVDPIIGSLYSFLCLFRAGFNVLTWQDPMLTFWLSLFSIGLSVVLFFFPWRLFLFLLGVWFVGPQNWVIRILRERGHLPPISKPKLDADKKPEEEIPLDAQPIFTENHRKPGNEIPKPPENIDPREVHRVVVPFSPLMYQRFYDWPPETLYAQVKPELTEEARHRRTLHALLKSARRPHRRPSMMLRNWVPSRVSIATIDHMLSDNGTKRHQKQS